MKQTKILSSLLLLSTFGFSQNLPVAKAEEKIIDAGQFLDKFNLCPATSGNLSVRVDEKLVAITVSGKHKGDLTPEDIMLVDLEGKPHTKKPSAETLLHTVVYSLFKDVGAVLHTHTLNGTVLSRLVAPEKQLVTKGYELHKVFPGISTHESTLTIPIFENSQDMAALAKEVADYLKANPETYGFLVRGHGLYTWGQDMKEAKMRIAAFEYLFECETKLRLLAKPEQPLAQKETPPADEHYCKESIQAILTDIEGTTTSLSFAHDVLFPYAKEHVRGFLITHESEPEIAQIIKEVKELSLSPDADLEQVTQTLLNWMNEDKKITPLKTLQGYIWEEGFESGAFKGHLYEDAYTQLEAWEELHIPLYVYSSGSVKAQKLLFSHTRFGDLTSLFSGHFDTVVGGKKEMGSYETIAKKIGIAPEKILFLSDVIAELDAAKAAGMQTLLLCRDGALPEDAPHRAVHDFSEIEIR